MRVNPDAKVLVVVAEILLNRLLNPETARGLPLVTNWLNHAETTRRIVTENYGEATGDDLLEIAVQEHVLVQIENIQTHPAVAVKLQRGELTLHGWVYHLETGEILAYSGDDRCFEPLNKVDHTPAAQRVIDNPMLRK